MQADLKHSADGCSHTFFCFVFPLLLFLLPLSPFVSLSFSILVPTIAPGNVQAEAVNSTTIRFTWTAPNPQFINGINQGYKVSRCHGAVTSIDWNVRAELVVSHFLCTERQRSQEAKCIWSQLERWTLFTHLSGGGHSLYLAPIFHMFYCEAVCTWWWMSSLFCHGFLNIVHLFVSCAYFTETNVPQCVIKPHPWGPFSRWLCWDLIASLGIFFLPFCPSVQ